MPGTSGSPADAGFARGPASGGEATPEATPHDAAAGPVRLAARQLTLGDDVRGDGPVRHLSWSAFLVSREPELALSVRTGAVVRLWLTNTANTGVFNVRLPGAHELGGW
jgi:hypothetical protein